MEPGEVIGEYTIVSVAALSLRYRFTNGTKTWRALIGHFHEWMESEGHFRGRCNGKESNVADQRHSHPED